MQTVTGPGTLASPPPVRLTWTVVASRLEAALAHRTWSIKRTDGDARCHAFLIRQGHAGLSTSEGVEMEFTGPSLLWLPLGANAVFRLLAGSDGYMFSAAEDFAWRTVGESPVGAQMRPLLRKMLVAPPDRIAPHLDELIMSFDVLIRESCSPQSGATAMISANLTLVLLHLWRACGLAEQTALPRGAGVTTVQRFRQLIGLYYREGFKIDDYANILGVTRSHLHEACVRLAQRTPLAMVHDRLIAEARLRLEQTDLSIEQIGYSLGFRDAGYFNRFFKRQTGQSPGTFRRIAIAARSRGDRPSFAAWP